MKEVMTMSELKFIQLKKNNRELFDTAKEIFIVRPADSDDAEFVTKLYRQNIKSLHGKPIALDEWKNILSQTDKDERNFIIYRGSIQLAWLRVNGLLSNKSAWISMLVVSNNYHRRGVGSYAIEFAEEFAKQKNFRKIGIHTTADNIPAQNLYRKHGYTVTKYGEYTTGDGIRRMGYTFVKEIENI